MKIKAFLETKDGLVAVQPSSLTYPLADDQALRIEVCLNGREIAVVGDRAKHVFNELDRRVVEATIFTDKLDDLTQIIFVLGPQGRARLGLNTGRQLVGHIRITIQNVIFELLP